MIPERKLLSVDVDGLGLQEQTKAWWRSFHVKVIKYFKIKHEASILVLQNFQFFCPEYTCLWEKFY